MSLAADSRLEIEATVANADIGSQWQLTLVPLDEHGNASIEPEDKPIKRPTLAPHTRLMRQAGICCSDPVFTRFLEEHGMFRNLNAITANAAAAVRLICHVESRKEFIPGTPAGDRWEQLYSKFIGWRDAPERAA